MKSYSLYSIQQLKEKMKHYNYDKLFLRAIKVEIIYGIYSAGRGE